MSSDKPSCGTLQGYGRPYYYQCLLKLLMQE